MQDFPLRIMRLMDHAEREHGDARDRRRAGRRHDSSAPTGSAWRTTRGGWRRRWSGSGFKPGERVATLAMNHDRHLDRLVRRGRAWAASSTPLNPRLFDDQLDLHHQSRRGPGPPLRCGLRSLGRAAEVRAGHGRALTSASTTSSTSWLAAEDGDYRWHEGDERDPCGLCYTSGTTGNPKGVLYEHRSTVLHAMSIIAPDIFDLSARSVMLPVVPMFHANSWCIPYAAAIAGCKLVICADNEPERHLPPVQRRRRDPFGGRSDRLART